MPEIKHVGLPSIPAPAVEPAPAATPAPPPVETVQAVAPSPGVTPEVEEMVRKILLETKQASIAAAQPKEPDWATVTERDIYSPGIYIPTIEHQLPDYMNMRLKDAEYEVVWASRDQRRLGQLAAEGYELLRPEHVDPNFKLPLLFDSEKMYTYMDVVAMRVHKRILYSKRRRTITQTHEQIRRSAIGLPGNKNENAGQGTILNKGMEIYQVESIVG